MERMLLLKIGEVKPLHRAPSSGTSGPFIEPFTSRRQGAPEGYPLDGNRHRRTYSWRLLASDAV